MVAIGASAGGLPAVSALLAHVPPDTGLALVFVQHLDPKRASKLTPLLRASSRMPVHEVRGELQVRPNEIYVVPPAHGVLYVDGVLRLGPREVPAVPSTLIDDFMVSLAAGQGSLAVGVVLSGNGSDGVAGLAAIRAAAGTTLCQIPSSARNGAMPAAAIAAGVVDYVLDLEQLGLALARISSPLALPGPMIHDPQSADSTVTRAEGASVRQLLELLQSRSGVDFGAYKPAMVLRRVRRRIRHTGQADLAQYLAYVQKTPREASTLHTDLLIGVTSFFRDAGAFEGLKTKILPQLIADCAAGAPLRIWVPGAATGEEPYSIAMCVLEVAGERALGKVVQIFATDVRESAVARARAGIYPASIRRDLSSSRLARFFVEQGSSYRIAPEVRELCVFAQHDLMSDPPFSRMDLISCRNVLIYFDTATQRRVLTKLHNALTPRGLLLLGGSESVSRQSLLFERLDPQERIYKRHSAASDPRLRAKIEVVATTQPVPRPSEPQGLGYDVRKEADRVLLSRFVSAAILVDPMLQVIQFRGETGPFMGPLSGAASLHVLTLVDEALLPVLRHGIASAQKTRRPFRKKLMAQLQGVAQELKLEIVPLRSADGASGADVCCLIVLGHAPHMRGEPTVMKGTVGRLITQLKDELAMTRDHLRASLAEQESATESLRAALEELQSTNEELQVTNEELETGKEELQSTNEALTSASDEAQMRNAELGQLIHDHTTVVAAAGVAALLFGADGRLRRVSPIAASLLRLTAADLGRPLSELETGLRGADLCQTMEEAIAAAAPREAEVYGADERCYAVSMRPYRGLDGRTDGVVVTLTDVTPLRTTQAELALAKRQIAELQRLAGTTDAAQTSANPC